MTFIEDLDNILNAHAQEFKAGHMDTVRDGILNLVSERIIGEDIPKSNPNDHYINGYNHRGAVQRTTLYEGTKEER